MFFSSKSQYNSIFQYLYLKQHFYEFCIIDECQVVICWVRHKITNCSRLTAYCLLLLLLQIFTLFLDDSNEGEIMHSVPLGFQNPDIQNERRRVKVNRVHYDAMRYTIQTIKYIYIIQPTNYIMNHLILCTQKHFTPPPFTPGSYEELP